MQCYGINLCDLVTCAVLHLFGLPCFCMHQLFASDNVHSPLQIHIMPHLNSSVHCKTKHLCTSLARFVLAVIPFLPETFGVSVVAIFGAGVVVARAK